MNLDIFNCGPKTILRDETTLHMYFFYNISRKLFENKKYFIPKLNKIYLKNYFLDN